MLPMWTLRVLKAQRLAHIFSHAAISSQAHAVVATNLKGPSSMVSVPKPAIDPSDPATTGVRVCVTSSQKLKTSKPTLKVSTTLFEDLHIL